jgi:prepilin-type N-terminal cleavage/methylation domain-containing protein
VWAGDSGDDVKTSKGFSLLELLIVVAIILIIATIAIPNLLRSRQSANESAAVANMRNLNSAEVSYSSANGIYGDLTQLIASRLIDGRYSSANFSGFQYTVSLSINSRDYTAVATAVSPTNSRYDFYSTPDFVVRYSTITTRAPAGRGGQPVQ